MHANSYAFKKRSEIRREKKEFKHRCNQVSSVSFARENVVFVHFLSYRYVTRKTERNRVKARGI